MPGPDGFRSGPGGFRKRLKALALPRERPDGTPYLGLDESDAEALADAFELPLREVQALALECDVVPERYVRNFGAISYAKQRKLLRSRAMLVGLGGLGGYVLEILCRAGVGAIAAADGDTFEQSNLNRQLLSGMDTVLRPKADAALRRALAVNPAVELSAENVRLDLPAMRRMAEDADVVIDALGGLDDRPALVRAARDRNLPLVTAAIAGNTGYVATVLPGQPSPADFFGTGPAAEDDLGSPAACVSTAASLMTAEALRILHGSQPALAGRMLAFDLTDMTFQTLSIT